jgi:hypothetical protein
MKVSEERIQELMEQMLNNVDEDGWCHIPKGLSNDEGDALTRRLTLITMQDRIDSLMEGILGTLDFMNNVKGNLDEYEILERVKIKGMLFTVKEDSQTILIDLHSEDKITNFFKIDLVVGEDVDAQEEIDATKKMMGELIETEFSGPMSNIIRYCHSMIEIADELLDLLNEKK